MSDSLDKNLTPTYKPSEVSRSYRRMQAVGAKRIIKKLSRGMTPEEVARKTGAPIEAVMHLYSIMNIQKTGPAETEIFINGEEIK